jgi:hypothetical protein
MFQKTHALTKIIIPLTTTTIRRNNNQIISEESMKWINEQIKAKRFKDVSHAIEYAIYQLMKEGIE